MNKSIVVAQALCLLGLSSTAFALNYGYPDIFIGEVAEPAKILIENDKVVDLINKQATTTEVLESKRSFKLTQIKEDPGGAYACPNYCGSLCAAVQLTYVDANNANNYCNVKLLDTLGQYASLGSGLHTPVTITVTCHGNLSYTGFTSDVVSKEKGSYPKNYIYHLHFKFANY